MFTQFKFSEVVKKITAGCFALLLAVIFLSAFSPATALAQDLGAAVDENLTEVGTASGLSTGQTDLRVVVGRIIKAALGLLGAVALSLVIYGGYLYMTSGGDPAKVDKAKQVLLNAFIGLLIIILSYAIVAFIFRALTDEDGGKVLFSGLAPGYGLSGGAFGSVIVSHYPTPEQREVPRNTMIMVTFRMPVQAETLLMEGEGDCPDALNEDGKVCGALNKSAIKILRCADMSTWPEEEGRALDNCVEVPVAVPTDETGLAKAVDGYAFMTEDRRTVIINPYGDTDEHLGSAEENVSYIVHLSTSILKDNDESIFPLGSNGYFWRFTTGKVLDLIPPKILSVVPKNTLYPDKSNYKLDKDGTVYLNQVLLISFDEPMVPLLGQTQVGNTSDAQNEVQVINQSVLNLINCPAETPTDLCLRAGETCPVSQTCFSHGAQCERYGENFCEALTTPHVPGSWQVGLNAYKTVQFTSAMPCVGFGLNSCGEVARCLPASASVTVFARAADLQGGIAIPTTGLMDAAGNSLDGNKNGRSDGQSDYEYNGLPVNPVYPLWDARSETPDILEIKNALKDDYYYRFLTGGSVDLTPPVISGLKPTSGEGNLAVDVPLIIEWNEDMEPYSVDTQIKLFGDNGSGVAFNGWFDPNFGDKEVTEAGATTTVTDYATVVLTHGPFATHVVGNDSPLYTPVIKAQVKDSRQNCFTPSKDSGLAGSSCGTQIGNFPDFAGYSCCPTFANNELSNAILNSSTDPICAVPHEPLPQCQDGLDNDGDELIDFAPPTGKTKDNNCSSEWDDDEAN